MQHVEEPARRVEFEETGPERHQQDVGGGQTGGDAGAPAAAAPATARSRDSE